MIFVRALIVLGGFDPLLDPHVRRETNSVEV